MSDKKLLSMRLDDRTSYYLDELMKSCNLNRTGVVAMAIGEFAKLREIEYIKSESESKLDLDSVEIDKAIQLKFNKLTSSLYQEQKKLSEERKNFDENEQEYKILTMTMTSVQHKINTLSQLIQDNQKDIHQKQNQNNKSIEEELNDFDMTKDY